MLESSEKYICRLALVEPGGAEIIFRRIFPLFLDLTLKFYASAWKPFEFSFWVHWEAALCTFKFSGSNSRYNSLYLLKNQQDRWIPISWFSVWWICWCLDDPSTDKPTTRQFGPHYPSTQRSVGCDNSPLWHSDSKWIDCLSTQKSNISS